MIPKALFIEAGHGKNVFGLNDPGATGSFAGKKITEREITVALGRDVLAILKAKEELNDTLVQGVGVETSPNVLSKMSYVRKVIEENGFLPASKSFGVAIHVNGNYNRSGIMGYYQKSNPAGIKFLDSILQSIHTYFPTLKIENILPSSKSRFGRLYVDDAYVQGSYVNYVLLETGYIGNSHDQILLMTQRERYAEAIAHGILEYFRHNK